MEVTLPTGATCAYDRLGDTAAPAVVLIHGLSGSRETYAAVVGHLTNVHGDSLQILNVDLRGHGDSARTPIEGYTAAGFAADVDALIDRLGLGPALIVGHSLGGVVAAYLAVHHPEQVQSILLEDPPLFEGDADRRAVSPVASFFPMLIAAVRRLQGDDAPLAAYEELAATHTGPVDVAERARSLWRWDPTTMQAAVDGIVWRGFDPLAAIGCPLTVLRADPAAGAVFEPQDADALASANPHARIHVVPGASHSIHAAATRPAYLAHLDTAIEAFLSS
jgi:pimeloyl-ACP methyl ester carboxylesterase